jgi:hypothetical protein
LAAGRRAAAGRAEAAAFLAADLTPTVRTTCRAGGALRTLGRGADDDPPRAAADDTERDDDGAAVRRAGDFATAGGPPALPRRGDARRSSAGVGAALTSRGGSTRESRAA